MDLKESNNNLKTIYQSILQTTIDLSRDPEAKISPFGENTMLQTSSVWPLSLLTSSPVDTFQIPIVLSFDPEAKYSPFG